MLSIVPIKQKLYQNISVIWAKWLSARNSDKKVYILGKLIKLVSQ